MPHDPTAVVGIRFGEWMSGYVAAGAREHQEGWEQGGEADSPLRMELTVSVGDVERMLSEPAYTARVTGTVEAPALSPGPLAVTEGHYNLIVTDPRDPAQLHRVTYELRLTDVRGGAYWLSGSKHIRSEKGGLDLWADVSTLYVDLAEGGSPGGSVLGRGIVRASPAEFTRQLRSFEVTGAGTPLERLRVAGRFGRHLAGALFDVYGGVFARHTLFDPEAPPREKRPLRAPTPEVHYAETEDGLTLRLTRYQGGAKGPVMLVHGLGVSSFAFTLDTIDTNLVEYLTASGYDVWLLDLRVSIESPYADQPSTADDLARYDFPAAVDRVREVTGAADIQVVVHCYGAIAFHMAMLAGLEGVRSAVSSQVGAHIDVLRTTQVKSLLHLPQVLKALGIKSMTMRTDAYDGWPDRLYNRALAWNPSIAAEERCDNPVCYRVTFLYAPLYEHDQLNNATHAVMHELFGVASMENFEHLTRMALAGQLVDAAGEDVYLPHVKRLAIPITYIHGAENETWLPGATERTYQWLAEHNGAYRYRRHVIPRYGHIDCIFGKDAARDVYPLILQHLEETALTEA